MKSEASEILRQQLEPVAQSADVRSNGEEAMPYATPWEHLQDELQRLDARLALCARGLRRGRSAGSLESFRSLVISDEEVDGILAELDPDPRSGEGGVRHPSPAHDSEPTAAFREKVQRLDRHIDQRLAATSRDKIDLPFLQLSVLFRLTRLEEQCLVLCIAPELDRRYERLYGYLQDDITLRRPTVGFLFDLLGLGNEERLAARSSFDREGTICRHRLCRVGRGTSDGPVALLSRTLSLDDRVIDFLLGRRRIDGRVSELVRRGRADGTAPSALESEFEQRVCAFVRASRGDVGAARNLLFHLRGGPTAGARALAQRTCERLGVPLLVADLERLLASADTFGEMVELMAREAILVPAALCFENFDLLLAHPARAVHLPALLEATGQSSRITFLLGHAPWWPDGAVDGRPFLTVEMSRFESRAHRDTWETQAHLVLGTSDIDWGSLAGRFRFSSSQVRQALVMAGHLSRWRSPEAPVVTMDDLEDACRSVGTTRISSAARTLPVRRRSEELVLPPDTRALLDDLCRETRYRDRVFGEWGFGDKLTLGRGLTALFSGPPGTGKTMAAQILAGELGLDLYRVDLSQVVSKYIGETEKNLAQTFEQAEATQAILFFDEADALFGKRSEVKDAHDRYANIEVGFLLQRMEEFEGIAILATNLRQNLDEAFVRRLRFVVEFPFPDEEQRLGIWRVTFPEGAPLADDVDFGVLSREVRLAGGHIRNIGLAAAFYAAGDGGIIGMRHLLRAAAREYEKLGKSWEPPTSTKRSKTP